MILTDFDYATVSETKAGLSGLLKRLKETHRPVAVTSHGKPAGVLLGFDEYRSLLQRAESMESVREKPHTYVSAADPIEAVRGSTKGMLKALLRERRKERDREDRPRRG